MHTKFPPRDKLVLNLSKGTMSSGDVESSTGKIDDPDEVLVRYLAFIYFLRNLPIGSPISLRNDDLEILSEALKIKTSEIENRLKQLVNSENVATEQRRFQLRTLAPVAGVVLAVCSAGLLVASLGGSPEPETDISTASVVTLEIVTDIGAGGAVEYNSGS